MGALDNYPGITPFLWFNENAEEAVDFYLTVFKDSRLLNRLAAPDGKVLTIAFELDGQKFTALNGGPHFKFNEAVSFVVRCEDQDEVDDYWSKLSEGGIEGQCGWLKDRFGLSWQIVPARLGELIKHPKAMQAMMRMKKLDIAGLERAAEAWDALVNASTNSDLAASTLGVASRPTQTLATPAPSFTHSMHNLAVQPILLLASHPPA